MQIAVVLTAGAVKRQTVIGQNFQLHRRDLGERHGRDDRDRVLLGPGSAGQDRTVRLFRQRCTVRGNKRLGINRLPNGSLRAQFAFPFGDSLLCDRRQQFGGHVGRFLLEPNPPLQQRCAARGHHRVGVIRAIRPLDPREHRLQRVVIGLRNRIELVIVTPRTLRRQAGDVVDHVGDHVVAVKIPGDLPVQRVFADVLQRAFIPRSRGQESQRDRGLRIVGKQHVPRDLFLHEPAIRLVGVQRLDQVVAIRPGMLANPVLIVAMRLGEVGGVEPVPGPALAEAG